jgi:predicted metal-binding membrane protein
VAANSLRWRRWRATATFLAVYILGWAVFGALVFAASPLWSGIDPAVVFAFALALAAVWQLTVYKRRGLRDCHRPSPLPPRGSRATAGVIRFASRNGYACVRSCWAMMLAMAVASSATIFWMVAITGIVTIEKLVTKPRQATRLAAVVLGAGALVTGASIVIG